MKEILQHPNDILRQTAKEVPLEAITSAEIQQDIQDMKEALAGEDDGVAIAAPQIGISKQIFVVAGHVFHGDEDVPTPADQVYINPRIINRSKETEWMDEGCLSVRPTYGQVERAKKVTLEAYDETGGKSVRGASGLLAQIFQHETDHLNGVLFIDRAKDVRDIVDFEKEITD